MNQVMFEDYIHNGQRIRLGRREYMVNEGTAFAEVKEGWYIAVPGPMPEAAPVGPIEDKEIAANVAADYFSFGVDGRMHWGITELNSDCDESAGPSYMLNCAQ